jgi:hypothetical protein
MAGGRRARRVGPDQVSLGVLVTVIERAVVDRAVAAHGVGARRRDGKLPPHVVAYLTMALSLFSEDDYEEVARKVTGSLDDWGCWDASWTAPSASGITQARKRLGWAMMRAVFESIAAPIAGETHPLARTLASGPMRGAFLRSWRLMAIDGFEVDVPDTRDNAEEFGYSGSGETRSAFPKIRVVAMAECGTHAMVAAEVEGCNVSETALAERLYGRLQHDQLLTADRNFYSFEAWCQAARTGAQLLWRAPTQLRLPVMRSLEDGSYLSVIPDSSLRGQRRERILRTARDTVGASDVPAGEDLHQAFEDSLHERGIDPESARLVRVVEYEVPDREGNGSGELIVLLSTITGTDDARASELAGGYHERWEQETAHDQLKTHLRGPGKILRSRLPDLARQEVWAWLAVHYATSVLITRAAQAVPIDPDRISYLDTLRIISRGAQGSAAFPP